MRSTSRFDARGAKLFGDATTHNVGRRLAIVLDGVVQSAPVIREPITGGHGQITGRFDIKEAQDLANVLRNGALPAPVKLLEERTVGPVARAGLDPAGDDLLRRRQRRWSCSSCWSTTAAAA